MSNSCGHKGCERPAKQVGLRLRASNGEVLKALLDVFYCSPHSQHLTLDLLLGREGWSSLTDHFNMIDGTQLNRENCQIYLVSSD
ncbi:MAG: hypothetical protein P1V97_20470 [Planctomycetota bacterium]|nr:hypothetical protein [Planctomycetota bacterium]